MQVHAAPPSKLISKITDLLHYITTLASGDPDTPACLYLRINGKENTTYKNFWEKQKQF